MRALLSSLALAALLAGPAWANEPPAAVKPVTDPYASRITGSQNYIATFGLRASISRGFDVKGVLAVDAGLDIPDAKMRKKAESLRPRLISTMRDAVLNYVSTIYRPGDRPDPDLIRARLQKAVDDVLGKDQARVALASVIVFE